MADCDEACTTSSSPKDDSVVCVACGFDLFSNPKIRNLGESFKGHSPEVHKQVCDLWIEIASKMTNAAFLVCDNTKMSRNCFNEYDKYALKFSEMKKKLANALSKLNWTTGQTKEQQEED